MTMIKNGLIGILGVAILLGAAGCSGSGTKPGTASPAGASIAPTPAGYDFTAWDEKKVYDFLKEVQDYTKPLLSKTYPTKEEIVALYQKYFTPELSKTIVESTYFKTDKGWSTPEGDGGYMFILPVKDEHEGNKVEIKIEKASIQVKATYEMGLYSLIQYTIRHDGKPVITEWVMQ